MGRGLKRRFYSFSESIKPDRLVDIKLLTNEIEDRFSRSADFPSRRINLDPGYISPAKLVLASTKNYSHRIYLAKGIYAEVTLYFEKGTFHSFPWTYPDYKSKEYLEIFNKIRGGYLKILKTNRA